MTRPGLSASDDVNFTNDESEESVPLSNSIGLFSWLEEMQNAQKELSKVDGNPPPEMVAATLEAWSIEDVRQLVEEIEAQHESRAKQPQISDRKFNEGSISRH